MRTERLNTPVLSESKQASKKERREREREGGGEEIKGKWWEEIKGKW